MSREDTLDEPLLWSDALLVGHAAIDLAHREFVEMAQGLRDADDTAQAARLAALVEHVRAHFAEEESLMDQTDFPAAQCHRDEHAAMLKSAEEVRQVLAEGRHDIVRDFAQALCDWLPAHIVHLDSSLAQWAFREQSAPGNKPVLIKRGVARPHAQV